ATAPRRRAADLGADLAGLHLSALVYRNTRANRKRVLTQAAVRVNEHGRRQVTLAALDDDLLLMAGLLVGFLTVRGAFNDVLEVDRTRHLTQDDAVVRVPGEIGRAHV